MPGINAQVNYGANLAGTISQVAPLASSYHGTQSGWQAQQIVNQPTTGPKPSGLAQLAQKIESIGSESAHIVGGAGKFIGKTLVEAATAPVKFATTETQTLIDNYRSGTIKMSGDQLTQRLQSLTSDYKAGRISSSEYKTALTELNKNFSDLQQTQAKNQADINKRGVHLATTGIDTAADILTVMTAGIGGAAVKGAEAGATAKVATYLAGAGVKDAMAPAEEAVGKLAANKAVFDALPTAAKDAVQASTSQVLSQAGKQMTSQQIARATATKLLFTYPLTFNAFSGTGKQILKDIETKDYGGAVGQAVFNAALLLSGGPIGWALEKGGAASRAVTTAVFGDKGFIDTLAERSGVAAADLRAELEKNPSMLRNFAAMANTNVQAMKGNVSDAVDRFMGGLKNAGWDTSSMTAEQLVKDPQNWADASRIQNAELIAKGMTPEQAAKYTVGRWTATDSNFVAAEITKSEGGILPSNEEMAQRWDSLKQQFPGASFANSPSLGSQIEDAIRSGTSANNVGDKIRGIEAGLGTSKLSAATQRQLAKLGFVEIAPVNLEAPFRDALTTGGKTEDFFLKSVEPLPVLGSIGSLLTSVGLSPNAATQKTYEIFNTNLGRNIDAAKLELAGVFGRSPDEAATYITRSLANYAKNMKTSIFSPMVTDYRQFTTGDIMKALNATKPQAQAIKAALMDSMLQVPLSVRGLGDRILDANYKINPLAGAYARYQGALRFSYNPFFQAKLSYKAEILSQIEAGGKFPTIAGTNKILSTIMPQKYAQLDEISRTLESKGMFGAGYAAEGADEQAAGYSLLQHKLLPSQERSIAGLVGVMADKAGMTADQFVEAFPQETKDTVRMILQYDPRANFLNSPMARTLNYAFFPFRFNLKVSTIMARSLGRQSLGVQMAVINGMMQAHQYLNSPEGQAWYSKNADVIGLFKYFSPLETLSSISQALGAKPGNVAAYGELGGLPFGWIPGLLNAEGLIDTGTPYVNPTTGAVAKQYVPISARGRAQAAIEDFIGALFTYPGSTIGLPSKTTVDVKIAQALVPGGSTSTNFKTVTPTNLSPQQQQFQQVVQQLHGTAPAVAGPNTLQAGTQAYPAKDPFNAPGIDVPVQQSPLTTPVPRSRRSSTKKLKKSQFTPELLPGQTQLGQLP